MKYLIALLGALTMAGADLKMSKDLLNAPANPAAKVIVQFPLPPGQAQLDTVKLHGGLLGLDLGSGLDNARTVTISSDALAALASHPDVKYISPDRPLHGSLEFANPTVNADIAYK